MAPVSLPPRPPLAPPLSGQRSPADAQRQPRGAEREAFEPAAYAKVQRPQQPAAARPSAPAAAETRHAFTLQTLSAYAGVLVGQIERSVAPLGASPPAASSAQGPAGPPEAPGSRLNIKV